MSEFKPFFVTVDGRDIELTYDNHGIAQFRHTPEYDYIDITEELGPDEEETRHTLIFRHRQLCLWMGRVALTKEDQEILDDFETANEPFYSLTGYNSKVFLEDRATEFEIEMHTQSMLMDLSGADTVPEDWV